MRSSKDGVWKSTHPSILVLRSPFLHALFFLKESSKELKVAFATLCKMGKRLNDQVDASVSYAVTAGSTYYYRLIPLILWEWSVMRAFVLEIEESPRHDVIESKGLRGRLSRQLAIEL